MTRKIAPRYWLVGAALALALGLILHSDLAHRSWVARMSLEGSPPPKGDPHSPTGYELGQRHLLTAHQRGETYRWIAETQDFIARGPWASSTYEADTLPAGRPRLLPTLYAAWLAAIAWGIHAITAQPIGIAVEHAALWEPVISHVLAFAGVVGFMWRRHGAVSAALAGLFFAVFPPLVGQFLAGVLTTTTWALLFAAHAIALNLPVGGERRTNFAFSPGAAISASLALWLDPAFGLPAVLISSAAGGGSILARKGTYPFLTWSLIGAGATLLACLIDQNPWSPAAGELRYVHPWYALAWLGLGLLLDGWQNLRSPDGRRRQRLVGMAAAIPLVGGLALTQINAGFAGWLYTGAALRRLSSLDETTVFHSVFAWLAQASSVEAALVLAPVLAAITALAWSRWRRPVSSAEAPSSFVIPTIVLGGVVVLTVFKLRWHVVASLVALPLVWQLASRASLAGQRSLLAAAAVFIVGLIAWGKNLPASLQRPSKTAALSPADLEALVHRHFSHWLASHNPGHALAVLAPPELSDSLIFHGGCRGLMSTAWESYPGHVAASRLLSAPETSEAEAVLDSLQLTHVVLTSWDKVLPLLARDPEVEGKDTLYARLQRWVLPRFLRPVPYRLPPVPGYGDQKLAVFKVTAPQDEALALSRLAEYFVETDRAEPAGLVAKVLAESFPDDPNAAIARTLVHAHAGNEAGMERELARLASDATAGKVPFSWDRRVQRAIVLTIGRRPELARAEIAACLATASDADLFELTPLQAHRLRALAKRFLVEFPDQKLADLLEVLGAEYAAGPPVSSVNR